jgi:hypothetical protein
LSKCYLAFLLNNYLDVEVNFTEPSSSVSVPCLKFDHSVVNYAEKVL